MPVVTIDLVAGRSEPTKAELARRVTDAVASVCGSPPEDVHVLVRDVPAEAWFVAGTSVAERRRAK
jgi:4-oxalocrotonate tautomerase